MKHCLADKRLLACYTKEGVYQDLAHLRSCTTCAKRFRQLGREMELIDKVLRSEPPALERVPVSRRGLALPRVAVAAMLALTLFSGGWWLGRVNATPPSFDSSGGSWAAALPLEDSSAAGRSMPPLATVTNDPAPLSPDLFVAYLDTLGSHNACAGQDSLAPECF
ncbi:MAG: hypothetical protein ACREQ4_00635 [Candidatus Binataceae bacterium]